ncbi:response regulator transcription factor (plasmid) [Ensifer adhaerens]|uniref:response regulator transcription factor n=1 Tax=Ensifer adhaerens TaxID=106592 RepID=UPI0023A99B02|nr:response regulator transcription factor [Ensifer adhaerens]WDZ79738.1 response regulator transcription factor [Ensifer adhaerens]
MSISSGTPCRKDRTPTGIVIEHQTLVRSVIVAVLEYELSGWNFIDMVSTDSLDQALGYDVRLIVLDLSARNDGGCILHAELAEIRKRFPDVPVAVLSDTDDRTTAADVLKLGVRGFFTTSLRIELALAGLRLVLAGGVFCPDPLAALTDCAAAARHSERVQISAYRSEFALADFTPREADVLAELRCGSSNKVIAGKLNLSDHTVKMHLQHIMRKLQVQNRTEVVALLADRGTAGNGQGAATNGSSVVSVMSFRASR